MKTRGLLSVLLFTFSTFFTLAQNVDTCRTQEQFQKELWEFGEKTREYIRKQLEEVNKTSLSDTTQQPNQIERSTLNYTHNILNKLNEQILLPLEINPLLGDTTSTKQLIAKPDWDNAYFIKKKGLNSHLVVPLTAGNIVAELNIIGNLASYIQYVSSIFTLTNESTTEFIALNSNI